MRSALQFFDAGFTTQVSVVPPTGVVSPESTLGQEDAGKVPGRVNYKGLYVGYNWMSHVPNREEVAAWVAQGNSIGFGAWDYPAIDIDVTDAKASADVVATLEEFFGPCLVRVGREPKALLVFRCSSPLRSFDMRYTRSRPLIGVEEHQLIQFLGVGRQYVMDGIHPGTLKPYTIHDPKRALSLMGPPALPELNQENLIEAFDIIKEVMAKHGFESHGSAQARLADENVPQDSLKAPSMDKLAELVSLIPNETPDRHEYVAVGYAIKAASQDDPGAGLDIFQEWCSRWADGTNDPSQVERDWEKMVPPYRAGYEWLLSKGKSWGADTAVFEFGQGVGPQPPPVAPSSASDHEQDEYGAGTTGAWSDLDLADRFVKAWRGRLLFLPELGEAQYEWNGKAWVRCRGDRIGHLVLQFMRRETQRMLMSVESDTKRAELGNRLGSFRVFSSVKKLVTSAEGIAGYVSELDNDPDILNTPDGAYDLRTGRLMPPEAGKTCIKSTLVAPDPDAHCPRWRQLLLEAMEGDHDRVAYLQKLLGYALTGHTKEQIFPFFLGTGGNGKSVVMTTIQKGIMGPYAQGAPVELFQHQRGGVGPNSDYLLAKLVGARLVVTSETKFGGQWDEHRVKQLTGEDVVTARLPYGKPFDFTMQATLVVLGNNAPDLEAVSDAMTRRLHIVPWDFKPPIPDPDLPHKLEAELPGILAWCMEGARMWYAEGLGVPDAIRTETSDYFGEQDSLGAWLAECVEVSRERAAADRAEGRIVLSNDLYESYCAWRPVNHGRMYNASKFGQLIAPRLRGAGASRRRNGNHRGWCGIELKAPAMRDNVVPFKATSPHQ